MPYYAQKIYQDQLGNGTFTIAEAGCLLTAISNRLLKWGITMPPPQLNQWFKDHHDYIGPDNLSWNSISQFDPLIHFQDSGNDPMPPSPDAIVKFHYQSIQTPYLLIDGKEVPNMVDHFCAIDRISDGQLFIIDSWDGLIKGPAQYEGPYHKPIAWATYVKTVPAAAPAPAPAAPAYTPPAAPVVAPPVEKYKIITKIPGYMTANQAANHLSSNSQVPVDSYYVYNKDAGMINVSPVYGRPGWWINPADNTLTPIPPPVVPAVPAPAPVAPVHNEAAQATPAPAASSKTQDPPNWRASYKQHQGNYYALSSMVVHDLSGGRPDVMLHKYDIVPVAGTFIGPDGVLYARSKTSVKNYWWYGVPMNALMLEDELFSTATDTATRQATGTMNLRDHLVVLIGKFAGWLERLGNKQAAKTRR
jgi:hypothetical protein